MLLQDKQISPSYDPWEAFPRREQFGRNMLTSVEFTVTNLCNLRCEHCAVGDTLTIKEAEERVPIELLFRRLDEIEYLDTLSITGGEPMINKEIINDYILPLLRYAQERGTKTQLNSNLTLDIERYEAILPYLDVLHISFNYVDVQDFHRTVYAHTAYPVSLAQAEKTFQRLIDNTIQLAEQGVFVSAESLISHHTKHKLGRINHMLKEMGCQRHEVHPLYPSDFARDMQVLSLAELREVYHSFLDERDPDLWVLFGTLPFYACNQEEQDLQLIERIFAAPQVTVRNDPDGYNRLNCSIFSGDVTVTDFGDIGALGNVKHDSFEECFERWQNHPMKQTYTCFCPQSRCHGPNLLVANTYYQGVDFSKRKGIELK